MWRDRRKGGSHTQPCAGKAERARRASRNKKMHSGAKLNFGASRRDAAFTLIELLVVIAIIAILAALLLPALASAKQRACTGQCISNIHQISLAYRMYSDDFNGLYPESGGIIPWNFIDSSTHKFSWMQQLVSYVANTNVYHCPADVNSSYSYFNGVRAAYVAANDNLAAVDSRQILFSSAYVLSGDTIDFEIYDADKDDYSQNCVGGGANGTPAEAWQTHSLGQNILFDDGHARWYSGYVTNEMTFRYDSIQGWQ